MSSESYSSISVANLGKCYRLFERPQDRLKQGFLPRRRYFREFWALRGLSFSVGKGEMVGVVGRNGSGKSTLLEIIAGTVAPTTGTCESHGKVTALLELGSGFDPEFTGRENVFVSSSILGLSRKEAAARFDEIVDFAEVGAFVDQPVRTYSTGMRLRLAFAVQVFVPKEILIVDEVMAVGDEAFQRKCFGALEEFRRRGGTVLFVSHDTQLVTQMADRALLLDDGELLYDGRPKLVVNHYLKLVYAPRSTRTAIRDEIRGLGADSRAEVPAQPEPRARLRTTSREDFDPDLKPKKSVVYESRGARIDNARLSTLDGERVNLLQAGQTYRWQYDVCFDRASTNVRFGMLIKTVSGLELGGGVSAVPGAGLDVEPGARVSVCFKVRLNLAPGTYFLNAGVVGMLPEGETYLDRRVDVAMFKILPEDEWLATGHVNFDVEPQVVLEEVHNL